MQNSGLSSGQHNKHGKRPLVLGLLILINLILAGAIAYLMLHNHKPDPGTLYGDVTDQYTGDPVFNATVTAFDQAGPSGNNLTYIAYTESDGSFHLQLPPGDYTVLVRADGYIAIELEDVFTIASNTDTPVYSVLLQQYPSASTAQEPVADEKERPSAESDSGSTSVTEPGSSSESGSGQEPGSSSESGSGQEPGSSSESGSSSGAEPSSVTEPSFEEIHFDIDSSQAENYSYNLDPEEYLRYVSADNPDFYFYYPANLFNKVISSFDYVNTTGGKNLETHTFTGSKGSVLTFTLAQRTDSRTLEDEKKALAASESSEIIKSYFEIPADPPKGSNYAISVMTGYDKSGFIIYKLIRITPSKVMTMRIQCPPYRNDNDMQQKRYVQECIYRYCSFANDGHSAPRTYTKYLQDEE